MSETKQAGEFENWCGIKITDASLAPKAAALVRAYQDAWEACAEGIAQMLEDDAPTHDDGMYGGIATETLRNAAKLIRKKYGVTL